MRWIKTYWGILCSSLINVACVVGACYINKCQCFLWIICLITFCSTLWSGYKATLVEQTAKSHSDVFIIKGDDVEE